VVNSAARRDGEIFPPAAAPTSEHRRVGLQGSESRNLRPPLGLDGYKPGATSSTQWWYSTTTRGISR
jgi:hypothetical protein